ncbi:MAG: glycosyltransferase family 4 protein [Deltaproteobacteria bacterium]|nr:glycosyltransferase family 4 protein [Deltaproteobacteria bacterium]
MRIALVSRGFSLSWGGAERVAVSVAMELTRAGHDVHVYAGRAEAAAAPPDGVTLHRVPSGGAFPSAIKVLSFNRNLREGLNSGGYDAVLGLTQVFPLDVYRASGGVHAHWMRLRYPNRLARALKYMTSPVHLAVVWLEKKIMEPGNHRLIIANSNLVKGHIKGYFNVADADVRVVYNGVDRDVFNPGVKRFREEVRRRLGVGDERVVGLFVSNNWERKGLATVLRALSPGGGVTVVVVGRGRKGRFSRLAKRLGLGGESVVFAGTTERIEEFYGAADFSVLPTQYDPCSNTCLEAMACGLPVVTTMTNGASELVTHGENGFVLDEWDDARTLKGFLTQLADGRTRERMGAKAHEAMRDFTWERTAREIAGICGEAVAIKRKKGAGPR